MRRTLALAGGLAIAAAYFALSALPALSADTGTVNAQVTVATACITLDKTLLDFGSLSFSQPNQGGTSQPLTVTNCGSAAKLFGRGTDAKNGAGTITWTLVDGDPCTVGINHYASSLGGSTPSWGVLLSTADKQLLGNSLLGSGSAATMGNGLLMPCTGSSGSGQIMSWQIVFTATL